MWHCSLIFVNYFFRPNCVCFWVSTSLSTGHNRSARLWMPPRARGMWRCPGRWKKVGTLISSELTTGQTCFLYIIGKCSYLNNLSVQTKHSVKPAGFEKCSFKSGPSGRKTTGHIRWRRLHMLHSLIQSMVGPWRADSKGKRCCTHTAPCSCESWNMTSGMNCAPGHCDLRSTKVKLQAGVAVVLFPTYVWTNKALFNIRWRILTGIKPKNMLYEKWQQQILNLQSELLPIPPFSLLPQCCSADLSLPSPSPPSLLCTTVPLDYRGNSTHSHLLYQTEPRQQAAEFLRYCVTYFDCHMISCLLIISIYGHSVFQWQVPEDWQCEGSSWVKVSSFMETFNFIPSRGI